MIPWAGGVIDGAACEGLDDVLFTRAGGLFQWDGATITRLAAPEGLTTLWRENDRLIAAGDDALVLREAGQWGAILHMRPGVFLRDVAMSPGAVWIAFDNGSAGLNLLRYADGVVVDRSIAGLEEIVSIAYDGAGSVWVGDSTTGIVRVAD